MLNTFQVTSIQNALITAGLHYFDANGVWDNNTTQSYRQYHAVVLLKPDHTLEQPHHIRSVCAELLELSGLTAENNYGENVDEAGDAGEGADDLDDDDEDLDSDDDSDLTDEQIAALNGEGGDRKTLVIDGNDLSPEEIEQIKTDFLAINPTGSAIVSTGEQAVVVDGSVNQLQEGFQLDQADLDQINGQAEQQEPEAAEQAEQQEQQEQTEETGADQAQEEQVEQQQEETAAPAQKLTKAQKRAADKLAAEQKAAEEAGE